MGALQQFWLQLYQNTARTLLPLPQSLHSLRHTHTHPSGYKKASWFAALNSHSISIPGIPPLCTLWPTSQWTPPASRHPPAAPPWSREPPHKASLSGAEAWTLECRSYVHPWEGTSRTRDLEGSGFRDLKWQRSDQENKKLRWCWNYWADGGQWDLLTSMTMVPGVSPSGWCQVSFDRWLVGQKRKNPAHLKWSSQNVSVCRMSLQIHQSSMQEDSDGQPQPGNPWQHSTPMGECKIC